MATIDTWYVPTNDTPLTIYISAEIKDQNGDPMSGESYGIHAKNGENANSGYVASRCDGCDGR